MKKNILIITYKFPPMGGIGTRRWVKFSKYLEKLGYQVHILTANYPYEDETTWLHDVSSHIHIHRFKSKYPLWLLSDKHDHRFIREFKRYSNFILKKILFYMDNAQYDAKEILTKSKKVINQYRIKNVIATGHPVSINYISTYLKIDNPDINLIQDYRDNWNDLNVYQYGNNGGFCLFKRKEKSAYQEFFTLFYSDKVVNVSHDLTRNLQNKHKNLENKFITLTNGYDIDDYRDIKISKNSFNMIYAGSLYNERIEAIYIVLDAMIALDDEYMNNNFKIVIYSNYDVGRLPLKYKKFIDKNIFFKNFISPKEVIKEMAKFSFCLSINSKFASYAFGTKIFDYMALEKKIMHISNGGVLSSLLKNSNQFVSNYDIENIKQTLLLMKESYMKNFSNKAENYSDFALDNLTLKLEKLFV